MSLPGKSLELTVLRSASASTSGCSSAIRFSSACAAVKKPASNVNNRVYPRRCILPKNRDGAAQHRARLALAPRDADPVEIFQHLDRQIAADAGAVFEFGSGEAPRRRGFGQFARDRGQALDCLGQKEPVGGDLRDPAETLDALQKACQRFRLERQLRGQLTHAQWPQLFGGKQRLYLFPQSLVLAAEARLMPGQSQHRAVADDLASALQFHERSLERRLRPPAAHPPEQR